MTSGSSSVKCPLSTRRGAPHLRQGLGCGTRTVEYCLIRGPTLVTDLVRLHGCKTESRSTLAAALVAVDAIASVVLINYLVGVGSREEASGKRAIYIYYAVQNTIRLLGSSAPKGGG